MDTIIMHPTLQRAIEHWNEVGKRIPSLIKKAKRNPLCIELINGDIWYFRGETEGTRALRGYRGTIIVDDIFDLNVALGEAFVKEGE